MSTSYSEIQEQALALEQALAHEMPEAGATASHEHANEAQEEVFFNHLAAMADRGGRSQALRRIALAAARAALRGRYQEPAGIEGEFHPEAGFEAQPEIHPEWNPVQRAQTGAQLEHLGHAAAEAATEQEAVEQFLPLIPLAAKFALPLAAKALPKVGAMFARKIAPKIIGRLAPHLTRGVANASRALFRSPTTRPLIHVIPHIARGTIADIVRFLAQRRNITPALALQLLARRMARTLANPRLLSTTYRNSLAADRRYHAHTRRLVGGVPGPASWNQGGWQPQPPAPAWNSGGYQAPASRPTPWVCPTCGR